MKDGFGVEWCTYRGISTKYTQSLDCSKFNALNFVFDIDNIKLITINNNNKDSKDIEKLLKSNFLNKFYLEKFEKQLNEIKKDWQNVSKTDSYFNMNKEINEINKKIQTIFYDFILDALSEMYNKYQMDESNFEIKKINKNNEDNSQDEGEKIFFEFLRRSDKFTYYFDNYVKSFEKIDFYHISHLLCDEFIHFKKIIKEKNTKDKNVKDNKNYFILIDSMYDEYKEKNKLNINDNYIFNYYESFTKSKLANINNNKKNYKLFCFDKDKIKNFMFFKKNENNKNNENIQNEINIQTADKIVMPSICYKRKNINFSLVYLFAMIFPFFNYEQCFNFLLCLLNKHVAQIKFCQRYYIYIILKSFYLHYAQNKNNGLFKDLTIENIKQYYNIIKAYLIDNKIFPNEEILFLLKRVLIENKIDLKPNNNNINENNEKKNDINIDEISKIDETANYLSLGYEIVTKKEKSQKLILHISQEKLEHPCFNSEDDIYNSIYSLYEILLEHNFKADLLEERANAIISIMVNILFICLNKGESNKDMALYLFKSIYIYKAKKEIFNNNKKK